MESNILEMKNIRKRFGGITALENVSLSVKQGEIVAIAGENGAGKSTLMKILAGFYRPDSGDILFEGKKVLLKSARDSQRIGIETLYQDGALVDDLEICRNIFMGRELTNILGFMQLSRIRQYSQDIMKSMGLNVQSVDRNVGLLSGGEKQGVALGRAIYFKARLISMDEPTVALSAKGVQKVIDFTSELKEKGITVLFITHALHHIYDLADRVVLMKRGQIVYNERKESSSIEELNRVLIS
jgi:simple sugar transport system ATP-binding protein